MSPNPLSFQLDTYWDCVVSAALQDGKNWKENQLQAKLAANEEIGVRLGGRNPISEKGGKLVKKPDYRNSSLSVCTG